MEFDAKNLSPEKLVSLYKELLLPRLIEEKMFLLLRQGKISKWFSAYGQEAISVGAALAMEPDEYLLPMHRNLGMFTARGIPLDRLFAQFQGKEHGFTMGRDRSFHFGSKDHHIVGMISHLGPQMGVADGIALASKLKKENKATLVVTGDGGASEGDFHEALNVAAVWGLPVIFLIENNQWGLSTPSSEQFKFQSFSDKGPAYGIDASQVDGNNVLEVFHEVKKVSADLRNNPRPHILECMTFRVRGHEEASGTKYYPDGLIDEWTRKDPVQNFEKFLFDQNILTSEVIDELKSKIQNRIEESFGLADKLPFPSPDEFKETKDVFVEFPWYSSEPEKSEKSAKRLVDAISEGLQQSMDKYPQLILMGQDIAEYGGVFKVTEGLVEKYGKERVRNTPLCESAILGTALGLSIQGFKSVVEMQFADFVSSGFTQVVNNIAKIHYRWGQNADLVIRMPTGAGVGAGPFHSQSNEAWFFKTPGLKIVYPSNPIDAKGLICSAIEDPNPVMFFEHKALYRAVSEEVHDEYFTTEIGKAKIIQEGEDATLVAYGMAVHWAKEASDILENSNVEIIDLRSLMPWDRETIETSVKKTGKVLVCHEDTLTGGIGGEIASWISENLFEYLDGPVMREGSLDTPVPFSKPLEDRFLPKGRILKKLKKLIEY